MVNHVMAPSYRAPVLRKFSKDQVYYYYLFQTLLPVDLEANHS